MPANSSKKERHRLKRKEKQAKLRRARNRSPFHRLAQDPREVVCYVNRNWHQETQASILALKTLPTGRHVMGAYLVDFGVCGLKDAWGKLDIMMDEFEDMLAHADDEVGVEKLDLDTARSLVAGGVRFAQMNGFRLPHRFERWVNVLGQIDWRNADISRFKMMFIGNLEDLKRRLIACPVEEFLKRRDVKFIIGDDDFTLLNDKDCALQEMIDQVQRKGTDAIRRWCFANHITPHPILDQAFEILVVAAAEGEEGFEEMNHRLEAQIMLRPPDEGRELLAAMDQIMRFIESVGNGDSNALLDFVENDEAGE